MSYEVINRDEKYFVWCNTTGKYLKVFGVKPEWTRDRADARVFVDVKVANIACGVFRERDRYELSEIWTVAEPISWKRRFGAYNYLQVYLRRDGSFGARYREGLDLVDITKTAKTIGVAKRLASQWYKKRDKTYDYAY